MKPLKFMKKYLKTMAENLYRLLEQIDGEKGLKIIPYKIAQKIKVYLLQNWIK